MKNRLVRFSSVLILIVILFTAATAFAADQVNLQLFFDPEVMNDVTGEIVVDVNLKNFNIAADGFLGNICGVAFSFKYNAEKFEIKKTDAGLVETIVDENTLVKSAGNIECEVDEATGNVSYTFMDASLGNNLISADGTLFRFTLISKEIGKFWNSSERYPIRFIPGSIGVVTYNLKTHTVGTIYAVEAIDGFIAAYNNPPTLIPQSVDKYLTFTAGNAEIDVDGTVSETDAAPFMKDDVLMIPVRYFCESIGMAVEWNEGIMTAGAYAEYKALAISIKEEVPRVYINSVISNTSVQPVEKDGRIYIPCDLALKLYRDAQVEQTGDSVTIYIP